MEGYIKSLSTSWKHVFKRAVRPGGKIPLKELYKDYGEKYNLKPNEEFVDWLKAVKLKKDLSSWEISMINEKAPEKEVKEEKKDLKDATKSEKSGRMANGLSIEEIVELPVRKAREIIPSINDLKLLKYALKEASPRSNKDSLCRILQKRIKDIEIAR